MQVICGELGRMVKTYVITGGPGTGKTATLNELKKRGFSILSECAREVANSDKRFIGKSVMEMNQQQFQDAVCDFEISRINGLKGRNIIFSDRGLGDSLAYYKFRGLNISKERLEFIKNFKYNGIFVLDFLDFYEQDKLRQESQEMQKKIHNMLINTYQEIGYKIIIVPFMSVKKRADFILDKIGKEKA